MLSRAFNELVNVNHCTDTLTNSSAIDHQLLSLNNSIGFSIDTVSSTKAVKNKNMIKEIKNSCTKIFLQTTAMINLHRY